MQELPQDTIVQMRDFMISKLGFSKFPTNDELVADFDIHLQMLIRSASIKMSAMLTVINSLEARLTNLSKSSGEGKAAIQTLDSEREANAKLTDELEAAMQLNKKYEEALRHIAEKALASRDWRFAQAILNGKSFEEATNLVDSSE